LQTVAKQKGHPWTLSKGFDGSACISHFIDAARLPRPDEAKFSLDVNGQRRQTGDCSLMIHSYAKLVSYVSSRFTLQEGDLIYTGTPEGVAAIKSGDKLTLRLDDLIEAGFDVA
ncbi:MAG: fumarylacetoacetate hydrolase family protein, partial [Burkholderiales bacterium]|nr:fumarylacetoacetate hydrolase family protein [Burkholderiales bacterium]